MFFLLYFTTTAEKKKEGVRKIMFVYHVIKVFSVTFENLFFTVGNYLEKAVIDNLMELLKSHTYEEGIEIICISQTTLVR